ncbi:hypothetical protein DXG03_000845 [Asterophora parasitica]|uniref:Inositol-pentakisphosphate 2-kinase n=1 Tax=Asterophora parasitica TaxID=117018 RepID=A0A9P7GHU9_9AGAR|nr:hypothetical protein DXG03_000845 [Asterophora parasitica]
MAAHVTNTLPDHWKYVSEGGATIVFSYFGPSNPQFDGTVLRLRKTLATSVEESSFVENTTDGEQDDPMLEFQHKCMERLIPVEHLPRLEPVHIDRTWLESLAALRDAERPEDRRRRDRIDVTRTKGILATDLVGGDWVAVEIKPKWAFLPNPAHLSDATRSIKMQTCRFCMHSAMKARAGDAVPLGYCPLDLFSGDETRIRTAIYGLWAAWDESKGTVNNLKIFVRGRKITRDEASLILSSDVDAAMSTEDIREHFTAALLPLLLDTPVLLTLSKIQRTLDPLDIEGLSHLWRLRETTSPPSTHAALGTDEPRDEPHTAAPIDVSSLVLTSPEPTTSDWIDFLDTYLSETIPQLDHTYPDLDNLRYYLLAYLLSATFKDCSIIVRLERLRPETLAQAVKPEYVTVIDLDPKAMSRLRKWEKLDHEIVTSYAAVADNRKICIDSRG